LSYGGYAPGFDANVDYAVYVHEAPEGTHFQRPGAGPHFLSAHIDARREEIPERLRKASEDATS
jgi:hypothetical protein